MRTFILLLIIHFSTTVHIQAQENLCYISLTMRPDDERVERAKFYSIARENIKVEFARIVFKNGESNFGKRYYA